MSRSFCIDTIDFSLVPAEAPLTWRAWFRAGARLAGREAVRLTDYLQGWRERVQQRRALMTLDDRLLKDIGLSRADVWHEYEKPFWR